jgi:hypothetical protein
MKSRRIGRRKGSRNKGFFYRNGRGWYSKDGSQFVPLTHENGERLRDRNTADDVVKEAHRRWEVSRKQKPAPRNLVTVEQVCNAYLSKAEKDARQTVQECVARTLRLDEHGADFFRVR